jgi:F0F1-type ATP synthase assembly protein I
MPVNTAPPAIPSIGNIHFFKRLCGLSTQLALEFVCAVVAGTWLGYYIDNKFNSFPIAFIIGFVFGTISAGAVLYRFVCRVSVSKDSQLNGQSTASGDLGRGEQPRT